MGLSNENKDVQHILLNSFHFKMEFCTKATYHFQAGIPQSIQTKSPEYFDVHKNIPPWLVFNAMKGGQK